MINSVKDVIDSGLCISCGSCVFGDNGYCGSMQENIKNGMYEPVFDGKETVGVSFCPGAGYPVESLGRSLFGSAGNGDLELGKWRYSCATRAKSGQLLKRASSGGVMTAIAHYLLKEGEVDGVLTTKIVYDGGKPRPVSFIADSLEQLLEAQGSKYCPVPVFSGINIDFNEDKKYLFIGTPCQVAGLRLHQQNDKILRKRFPITMANFCGGFRDLRETDALLDRAGFNKDGVSYFQYRGDGQPGFMRIRGNSGKERSLSYPGYARATGFIKHLRCRLCVDATGELADFSCGDAWIPRLLESGKSWSILLCRSEFAEKLYKDMLEKEVVEECSITVVEIKRSQAGNLNTKKKRQAARLKLYKLLGYRLPSIKEGYVPIAKGTLFELRVHLSHTFFYFLEKISLYKNFAKLINRYPKDMT